MKFIFKQVKFLRWILILLEDTMLSFACITWNITNILRKANSLIPIRILYILLIHKLRSLIIINQFHPAFLRENYTYIDKEIT